MKIFQFIFLSICALAEAAMFAFGILGLLAYVPDPDPNVPNAMVAAVTVCAIVMLGITIRSFIKLAKDRENPVLFGFLFKIPLLIFTLGICWFALGIPEAGWIAVIPSVIFGALILCLPRLKENNKKLKDTKKVVSMSQFTSEKAKWAWEDAAAEYRRIHNLPSNSQSLQELSRNGGTSGGGINGTEFSDEENEKIYRYAGTPTAYFLGWLIRNDHVSESFREAYGPEIIQSVRDQSITPVEVYAKYMDYVLSRDDIAPEILPFVDQYYRDGTREMAFNHSMRRYFFDYYKTVCSSYDVPRYYCVDFTWESFEQLSKILDRRLYEFRQNFDEKEMENTGEHLRSQYFDTAAELYVELGTPYAYIKKCAASFTDMSPGLMHEIAGFAIEYCDENLSEKPTAEWVLRHLSPEKVMVYQPLTEIRPMAGDAACGEAVPAEVPACMVLGENEWDPEHGFYFTVIGEHVTGFGSYADAEPPYEEDLQWRYRILEDASQENYCAAEVIPARFGEPKDSADNLVTIPRAAAERKQQYEDLIEALYILKLAEHYDCKITYNEGKPNYLFVQASAGERRTFADSIALQ